MPTTTRIAAIVASATLSLGAWGLAPQADASQSQPKEPCAQQQTQVDRAQGALDRVSAVFAHQQVKVHKAKKDVRHADEANEKAAAKRELADAKSHRTEAKKDKVAQQQRLAKAQQRLDRCEAEQPTEG